MAVIVANASATRQSVAMNRCPFGRSTRTIASYGEVRTKVRLKVNSAEERVRLERGDCTAQSDLPDGSLFKPTVAPQITPALNFFSRPSLRAFATWAHWSKSLHGSVAPEAYPDAPRGSASGVQFESWWLS